MSEMSDRVAEAMINAGINYDQPRNAVWRDLAKVAIEAMRSPTEGMISAATLLTTQCHGREAIYQAMIDEALKDG